MGGQLSLIAPPASTISIDAYITELENIQYERNIGNARFLKTIKGLHKDGLVVVKVFIKPSPGFDLSPYSEELNRQRALLIQVPNVIPYSRLLETERAGYLVRQHLRSNLYDRISTRPFLEPVEKLWVTFQLLSALSNCHKLDVFHGDIKTENLLVTSWNWIYLSDFAPFKPVYLPEDDPSLFSFFFDTSQRRSCYIAPERFLAPGEDKKGSLTASMDIFSVGCVIAELFLEGSPIFTLAQLFKYKNGEYIPSLAGIEDKSIRVCFNKGQA